MSIIPYLDKKFREELEVDAGLGPVVDYLQSLRDDGLWAGAVNYLNYRILLARLKRDKWKRYWRLALWIGTMVCCIFEAYRRIIGPYEDEAIQRNGDIE